MPRPVPLVGSTVEYRGRMLGSDCGRWTTQLPTGPDTLLLSCAGNTLERDRDGNPVQLRDAAGRTLVEFKPFLPALSFPLTADKHWSGKYTGYTAFNNLAWEGETRCKVAGEEHLTVAAGSFDTWRVECEDGWQVGRRTGSSHATRWYAPAAGVVVKEVHERDPAQWNFELSALGLSAATPAALETPPAGNAAPAAAPPAPPTPARPAAAPQPEILDPNEY